MGSPVGRVGVARGRGSAWGRDRVREPFRGRDHEWDQVCDHGDRVRSLEACEGGGAHGACSGPDLAEPCGGVDRGDVGEGRGGGGGGGAEVGDEADPGVGPSYWGEEGWGAELGGVKVLVT